jgi:hypothetical protein
MTSGPESLLEWQLRKSIELMTARRMDAEPQSPERSDNGARTAKQEVVTVSNGKFKKATSEQAFLKAALYGKAGSGKTLTALLWAEGLAAASGGRIAYVDTERGTEFYSLNIPERTVHPKAFDFDRLLTASLMETLEAVESINPREHSVVVIDSLTHLWEAARNAYTGKMTSKGGIPITAWQGIKKPYKKLVSALLDGDFHVIICGREGVVMEEDSDGDVNVVGTRMKAEGETPHEPHVLGRMIPRRVQGETSVVQVWFEKDRSGILTGRTFEWPSYSTIEPVVAYLSGKHQGKSSDADEAAETDAAKIEEREARVDAERVALFEQIKDAINNAANIDTLKAAWSLTSGKKGKLGERFEELEALKDSRKARLLRAEVA